MGAVTKAGTTKNASVCSVHFQQSNCARNLRHEMLSYCPANARRLKDDAISNQHVYLCMIVPLLIQKTKMRVSCLSVLSVIIAVSATTGVCERAFVFQASNNLSNVSRALIYLRPELLARAKTSDGVNEDPSIYAPDGEEATVSDLSVCVWMKLHYFRQTTSYLFSYATSLAKNNELNFGIQYKQILIAVGGKYVFGRDHILFVPYTWYHFCFVVNSEDRTGTFYVNGKLHKVNRLTQRHILMNGSLVLGQETDKVDGGYQELQSFCGTLTGFNLYSRPLDSSEVSMLASCHPGIEEGDLVAWSEAEWEISGPVDVQEIQKEEYCAPKNFNFVIFPKRRTHKEAQHLCRSLKSTIALPGNPGENSLLYRGSEPFVDECQPHNHATVFMWLGTTRGQDGTWTRQNGDPVTYSNFLAEQKRPCAGLKIPPNREEWHDVSCSSTYKFCATCQEEQQPVVLRMRGLCDSILHETFFRMGNQYGEMILFRGFTKYNIVYDNVGTWVLLDVWTGNVLAKFFTYDDEVPFGKRTWWTTTDFDICQNPSNTSMQLSLSACYEWEYSCNDGSCVNLSQRCDQRVDCPDNSDEVGCEKLWKPADYLGALPPPGVQPGSALLLNASLGIQGFSKINIRDMKLIVDFTMKIEWSDTRLRYKNLSPLRDLNYIEFSLQSVWLPQVELLNADFPKTFTTEPQVNIVRLSSPEEDDPSRIHKYEVYEGAKNSMELTQKFNAPFSCTMNMKNFPFDRQHCQLLIRFSSAKKEFMEWNDLSATYLGGESILFQNGRNSVGEINRFCWRCERLLKPHINLTYFASDDIAQVPSSIILVVSGTFSFLQELLAEYVVEDITIQKGAAEGYSLVVVGITFYRRYAYYLTSAYLPTIMLMIISYTSLFCKRENCDLRVMMALTTLLVLYALYQQISNDLPRTSYTKAIDVWCFFSITFIFSQVILHVFVNLKHMRPCLSSCLRPSSEVKEIAKKDNKASSAPENPESRQNSLHSEVPREHRAEGSVTGDDGQCNLLDYSRVFYLVLFGIFCVIYWSVVLTSE
ncbi:uncharacterized protein [Macrobrachium rosenbergii]|uniref:uncharacterized protein n=1 Tax=Macrobrachium rosenbergii TaxID=79674 RepID=UPI0034D74CDD